MNDVMTTNALTMSSLEIADLTNKTHFHVKRDIKSTLDALQLDASKFGCTYTDGQNREQTAYQLPKNLCLNLVAGYSIVLRQRIIDRWLELEQEKPALPDFSNPAAAARAWAEAYEQQQHTQQQLQAAQPAVNFMDRYVEAEGLQNLTQVAKVLGWGRSRFTQLLVNEQVLYRCNRDLVPRQYYTDQGYFSVKTGESNGHAFMQTFVTPRGVSWLAKRYGQELAA